jgi:hypothetical protein
MGGNAFLEVVRCRWKRQLLYNVQNQNSHLLKENFEDTKGENTIGK